MGCFIGCFRVRDDRHPHGQRSQPHLVSESSQPKLNEVVTSSNRLSSLFTSQDTEESPDKDKIGRLETPDIDKELKDEAKFLKACGTLAETPVEIRKASSKLNGSPDDDGHSEPSNFHSWLPNTSIKKLQLEDQPDQPATPVKLGEERNMALGSLEHTPRSCISSAQNTGTISVSSAEGCVTATNAQNRNKSVRFECDSDLYSWRGSTSENSSQNLKKSDSPGNQSISKFSPYPTPLKLSDEMQTPGTVFPANLDNCPNGKPRIRSQYVYSVSNSVESDSQRNVMKEEDSSFHQLSGELRESVDHPENPTPESKEEVKECLSDREMKVEASLSAWLKPVRPAQDGNNHNLGDFSNRPRVTRTPMDRPIIGMVAAHWNEDDPSRISPKWWDGNGIPNSTNKYKEDQKVSWHATPFEERLEKALSEETVITQRKDIYGKPLAFDENEESDTALSQLQSSHTKSVVSC
ncbi:hypothetical protein UlMin_020931 [Ulmus minor]